MIEHQVRRGTIRARNESTWRTYLRVAAIGGFMIVAAIGCSKRSGDRQVALQARMVSSKDPRVLEIAAQLAGSQEGIRYKWFSDAGECDPQESATPLTLFRFAPGTDVDHVTVDVWREGKRVGQSILEVHTAQPIDAAPAINLGLEITEIPLAQKGGPDTRTDIAGRVIGEIPPNCKVLVYARDDGVWYIQPVAFAKHEIRADGTWSTWSHAGYAYAALVVRSEFVPIRTLDMLPQLGGNVLARKIVEGREK